MGNFTSKSKSKKEAKISEIDKAILALKTQRKKLADQQKLLEVRIEGHLSVAKDLLAEKKKDRALLVIKKKKLVERQLEELGKHQLNIEGVINNVESSQQQNRLFQVLNQGNAALKELQKEVTVEDVQKLMDDSAEAKAQQDEMAAVLGMSLSPEAAQEAEEELAGLEEIELAAELAALPTVPRTKVQEPTRPLATQAEQPAALANQKEEEEEGEAMEGRQRTAMLAA